MTPSKILFFLCLSFILGIFLSFLFEIPEILIWAFLLISVILFIISFSISTLLVRSYWQGICLVLGFCIIVLCLGILRCQISFFNTQNNKLVKLNDNPQTMVLVGTVISEPDNRDKIQRLKIRADNLDGIILVTKNRFPEYNYSDKIKITGKLKTPAETADFSYKNYLLKDGVYSVVDFPKIELIAEKNYNFWRFLYAKIIFAKQKLRQSLSQNYLPPHSLIMEGMILGNSGAMTQELKTQLNITGLRHIIAVSGTHVIILSSILMYLFLSVGFWRGQAFYASVALIWFYIILTGLPASGIRAGIMATLFLLAQKIGRQAGGERVVVMACAVMLAINPLLLFYDVGFQLSFLAVLGLIYIDPFIKNMILTPFKKYKDKLEKIVGMFSATLSAQIFTVPIMLYNFGNISFISPVTNILVLPIVQPLMIFGFLSVFAGMFSDILGFALSVPSYFLLSYFIKIIEFFSGPWASKTIENAHWSWLVVMYFFIAMLVVWIKKQERKNKFY